MRNLFDQYDGPENRLTHALVCCLREDPRLLRAFVRWTTGLAPPSARRLEIVEQTLPGEAESGEREAEQRGLPDAWIHANDEWSLIIESKVASPVQADQLSRHRSTASRRGFEDLHLLVVSPEVPPKRSLGNAMHRTWPEVYLWFKRRESTSPWARRLTEYLEVAEDRMISSGYLKQGNLTVFSGIKFDADNPYTYGEAKRLLRLAMEELRASRKLHALGVDPDADGRPAITGRNEPHVWDFLQLERAKDAEGFTDYPHFTVAIHREFVLVIQIFPSGMRSQFRRNLKHLGKEGFEQRAMEVASNLIGHLDDVSGAQPWVEVVQRHYKTPSSAPIIDARLEFDLRTALPQSNTQGKSNSRVKRQPEWLDAAFKAMANKRSNLQLAVGARFLHSCTALHSPKAIDYIEGTWLACKPLLSAVLGEPQNK